MRALLLFAIIASVVSCSGSRVGAQFESRRGLSDVERRTALDALLAEPSSALSEDPSCRADVSKPGSMSIAQGLGVALTRAAVEQSPVKIVVDCFVRPGYPLAKGEESCRLGFVADPDDIGYGLAFVMDWNAKKVRSGSVECF